MKRDMELIRKILLALEAEEPGPPRGFDYGRFTGYNVMLISYHLELLSEAGLISYKDHRPTHGEAVLWWGVRLSWAGQEFLADTRNDTVWRETKQTVLDKVGSVSMTVMSELARHLVRAQVGL